MANATLKRGLKRSFKRLIRLGFETGQRAGLDVLPRHFYSEIPDLRLLKTSAHWKEARSMFGVLGDVDAQAAWVDECTREYRSGLRNFEVHQTAVRMNGSDEGYGQVEADFLYCYIRAKRPARIVQIGCGVSTAVCLLAAEHEGYSPRITCIEPYPTAFLKKEGEAGRLELVQKKLEEAGPDCAASLEDGDLLFVDSSHTLAPAGEVNIIILEMLPRLAKGVVAHFHDIYFPYDYSPNTLSSALFFPHETALLYAFLVMNGSYEVAASLSQLHHARVDALVRFSPDMQPRQFDQGLEKGTGHYPSSVFLRRIG